MDHDSYASRLMERIDILGAISEEEGRLTRRYGTPALRKASDTVAGWMRRAGMEVGEDGVGNLRARWNSNGSDKTLLLGSHLDTVRDAGKFDGPLGVLAAIACVERLRDKAVQLPFALEIAAFADEEGLRFHSLYLGSEAYTGRLDPALLQRADDAGITLGEAIRAYGGDPDHVNQGARSGTDLLCYCEVHIEQGPLLEAEGLPVGVVTAIQGQSRLTVGFDGTAGHAGTVPPAMRRDALAAGAELVLAVERLMQEVPGLLATVGQLVVEPGASNVIPGVVTLSLDIRHPDDAIRESSAAHLQQQAELMAQRRGVALRWRLLQASMAVACSPQLTRLLGMAIRNVGYGVRELASGAGHDGVVISTLAPIVMLFVRCKGGISHNPAELVTQEDAAVTLDVLDGFIELMALEHPS